MNEKLTTLLEEMGKNEKLQEEIKGAKDLDALYAVTTKYVDGYTKDELKEGIEQLRKMTGDNDSELSDEDLESVAGGSKSGQHLPGFRPSIPGIIEDPELKLLLEQFKA